MFTDFLFELRRRKIPVGTQEAISLARALKLGLHESSLDGFYNVARALLIHDEAHLDEFDVAFAATFRGIYLESKRITDELLEWLKDPARMRELSDEEKALIEALSLEEVQKLFEQRLAEQKQRHDGGNRWIGTGGTSPFGRGGVNPAGIQLGGPGGGKTAMQSADARRYQAYRQDVVLDVRQIEVALRKLRAFARDGMDDELDIEGTIDATARNVGELEIVMRPPRRPNTRVILMMDVGGSMDPYATLMSQLFSASKRATHWKELRTYYFHNCVYGKIYKTEGFRDPVNVSDVLHECGKNYKLVLVGDALMAPYELLGSYTYGGGEQVPGITWLMRLREHFERSVWLNPERPAIWNGTTIEAIAQVIPMFELTLEGLGLAIGELTKGTKTRR